MLKGKPTNSIAYPSVYPHAASPMGVYKNSKTSTSDSPIEGSTADSLYRWSVTFDESNLDQVTRMWYLLECLGFIVSTKKSILQVMELLSLFADSCRLSFNGDHASPNQNQTNLSRSLQTSNQSISTSNTRVYRGAGMVGQQHAPVRWNG